jgi:hypothetical protein
MGPPRSVDVHVPFAGAPASAGALIKTERRIITIAAFILLLLASP